MVLAADLACDEQDLLHDGVRVVPAAVRPGGRQLAHGSAVLLMATLGHGTVVSCDAARLAWAQATLGGLDRNQLFAPSTLARIAARLEQDGQVLAGPSLHFVCQADRLPPTPLPAGVHIDVVDGLALAALYHQRQFRHALAYLSERPRAELRAAVARLDGDGSVVGVAGASPEGAVLWQIGVDVVAAARGRGIGRAIVGRTTAALLERGQLPHYATLVSNVSSSRLALGLGYQLAWVELVAR